MELTIRVPGSLGVLPLIKAAYVQLTPGRGDARAMSSPGAFNRLDLPTEFVEEKPNVIAYATPVPGGVALGNGFGLEFFARNERPQPTRLVLELANDKHSVHDIDPRTLEAQPGPETNEGPKTLLTGPAGYVKEMWTAVAESGSSAKRFFADLDRRTHPQLIDAFRAQNPKEISEAEVIATKLAVSSLMIALGVHLRTRTSSGSSVSTAGMLHGHLFTHTRFIGHVFIECARRHFPDKSSSGIDLARFGAAFEEFALGKLATPLPGGHVCGQPSSGYYVFFSELAFCCIASGYERDVWTRLSRPMTYSQDAFFYVHRPGADAIPPYGIADYGPHTYNAGAVASYETSGKLASLKASFDGLELPQIAARASGYVQEHMPAILST